MISLICIPFAQICYVVSYQSYLDILVYTLTKFDYRRFTKLTLREYLLATNCHISVENRNDEVHKNQKQNHRGGVCEQSSREPGRHRNFPSTPSFSLQFELHAVSDSIPVGIVTNSNMITWCGEYVCLLPRLVITSGVM